MVSYVISLLNATHSHNYCRVVVRNQRELIKKEAEKETEPEKLLIKKEKNKESLHDKLSKFKDVMFENTEEHQYLIQAAERVLEKVKTT